MNRSFNNGFSSLSNSLSKITKKMDKQDPIMYRLIKHWPEIVGEELCELCKPNKVTYYSVDQQQFATLYVETFSSSTAMQVSFMTVMMMDRIAGYFGHKAISRIKIIQNLG